ncbi:MAG: hypothetical protein K9M56_08675 [Victivallales bacterium]|nr:hypothetical protein [Victivallales bacterium]
MQKEFKHAREKTKELIEAEKIKHHMFYGPTSKSYWTQKNKVLFINEEPYGYEDCGVVDVDKETLLGWFYDKGNTKTKTVKYSIAFIKVLLDSLQNDQEPNRSDLRTAYYANQELENILDKIAYYNIRSTSNNKKREDYNAIVASGNNVISQNIYMEIKALNPDIIIIGGDAARKAFNSMSNLYIDYKSCIKSENAIIQSIKHPSIPNYNDYIDAIKTITKKIKKS